ncbi:acrtyltransferase [Vibrio ishigakensis]|uniref:Chloramphenicol acetyltransferase n=1 Tax=Vibrio ishigakensis TaxID=1481914 RepID=A0A0B8NKT3_9VIBR|nr:CatB-related O-acetyltransferase [Vibrio ishigakensis]GAM55320.1 acrtyltransferase [Vibrio ishigakensis]
MKQFETWLAGQNLKEQVVNPNIEVGDHSYYSGFYHDKSFEEHAVRYLLGDGVTQDEWNSGVFGEVDKLRIGKFVSIASGATFMMAGNQGHRIDWISTFPFDSSEFGNGVKSGFKRAGDTVIGNDVWIGTEAMIMPGVRIGNGAVIGARSVITKDVEPYSVVVGNNHMVKKRFDDELIEVLERIQWWNWPLELLKGAMPILCSGDIKRLERYYLESGLS